MAATVGLHHPTSIGLHRQAKTGTCVCTVESDGWIADIYMTTEEMEGFIEQIAAAAQMGEHTMDQHIRRPLEEEEHGPRS